MKLPLTNINKNVLVILIIVSILMLITIFIFISSSSVFRKVWNYDIKLSNDIQKDWKNAERDIANSKNLLTLNSQSYRMFSLNLNKGFLDQKYIHASQNDIITIRINSSDKDYFLEIDNYNISIEIKKGTEKTVQFQAVQRGEFNIICKNCKNEKVGTIIIK